MFFKSIGSLLTIAIISTALASPTAYAQESEYSTRPIMVSSLSEVALMIGWSFGRNFQNGLDRASWNSDFTDYSFHMSIFVYSREGEEIEIQVQGTSWIDQDRNLSVKYIGESVSEGEPVALFGEAQWLFNEEFQSHNAMDFDLIVRFGEASLWDWVQGAELVVGGIVGGVGAVGGTTLSTAGAAVLAAPWTAAAGAGGGAAAAITISEVVSDITDTDDEERSPVNQPDRPERPKPESEVPVGEGKTLIAVSSDGRIFGSTPELDYIIDGIYSIEDGSASGQVYLNQ